MTDADQPPPPPSRVRRAPMWALVAIGIALGALLGLGAAALFANDDDDDPTLTLDPGTGYPADQAENAAAFLTAWERYRRATFVAELDFERLLPGGERLETQRTVVQDPPRRLVRQGATVSASDEDASLLCEPVGTETVCTPQPGVDYEASIQDELAGWRVAIEGEVPQYAVEVPESGCFVLRLVADVAAPPYGELTRVCFDDATGAVRSRQVTRATGTDTEVASSISATVTDDDWTVGG
jgi:hypothetical protein